MCIRDRYKEGLSWHPDGDRLTYMRYGPGAYGAENRWAFLDGSPTQTFIDMPERWDYVGRWAPDGDRFYFSSFGDDEQTRFVKRLSTAQIDPVTGDLSTPTWGDDGEHLVWENSETQHLFWSMEGF